MARRSSKDIREAVRIKKGRKKKLTVRKDGASYLEKKMTKELKDARKTS